MKVSPPRHRLIKCDPATLKFGAHFEHVDYDWRPFEERTPEAQADYQRLFWDVKKRGILNPLIAWRGHVLIGMRRCEIAEMLGIELVPVWEILDDLNEDATPARVFALRDLYKGAEY